MQGTRAFSALVTIVLLTAGICPARYSGGTGEPNSPYRIETPNDLNDIGNHVEDFNKCFVMADDINLADYNGTEFSIIAGSDTGGWYTMFEGVFDGNGHTITNLKLDVNRSMVGLFGYVGENGVVRNACLEAADIKGIYFVGGIAGRNEGVIQNCHVSGMVEGEEACGGITGACLGPIPHVSEIRNCSFRGRVTGTWSSGGIVGDTDGPEVANCFAIVEIIGDVDCGGVVGHNMGGNLTSCFAKGSVTCSYGAGGFDGTTYDHCGYGGQIRNCYADVIVNCSESAGGFSGSAPGQYGRILNCYCSGRVVYDANNHTDVGAFIGEYRSEPEGVSGSYFLETAGPDNGFGEPLSEEQMKQQASFVGWDFVEVWNIGENQTYPFLRVHSAGDINHDDRVNFLDLAILVDHWLEDGL
jgi:hypothetical protein